MWIEENGIGQDWAIIILCLKKTHHQHVVVVVCSSEDDEKDDDDFRFLKKNYFEKTTHKNRGFAKK